MKKIEATSENLKATITDFYKPAEQHFMVMNAVEAGDKMEIQWFFSAYAAPYDTTCFFALVSPDTEIPSIRDIVLSAGVAEAELVDLMNLRIEKTEKGFVLEEDSAPAPLLKKK